MFILHVRFTVIQVIQLPAISINADSEKALAKAVKGKKSMKPNLIRFET